MVEEESLPATCGRCLYFRRSQDSFYKGACLYYGRTTFAAKECMASEMLESELPRCQTCDKPIQPARTARSRSKFCVECWEVELKRQEEEKLRWENRYLTLGLEIAASENGGTAARCVAWCHWGVVAHQPDSQSSTGAMIGGAIGGLVGAAIGAALDSGVSKGETTYSGTIGLLAVTDADLVVIALGDLDFGHSTLLHVSDIRARSHDEHALAGRKVVRFPLSAIRPKSDGASIQFEFEGKARQFFVAKAVQIPHQPSPQELVRALRGAGTLLPVNEFGDLLLSGPPALNRAAWQSAVSNDRYWNDLNSWLAGANLSQQEVADFLSERAASVSDLQGDARYVDVLWLLFTRLRSEMQEQVSRKWLTVRPAFLNAFTERLRLRCQQQPFGHWFVTRKYLRLQAILVAKR